MTCLACICDRQLAVEHVFGYNADCPHTVPPVCRPGSARHTYFVVPRRRTVIEHRCLSAPLSLRASSTDRRTIEGTAAPFNELAEINSPYEGHFMEKIKPGAFARTIRERGPAGANKIRLLEQHDPRAFPVGIATLLEERSKGLFAAFRIAATDRGDEVLTLVRDGIIDGLSIGFQVVSDDWSDRHIASGLKVREIHEVKLREISIVTEQAYAGAVVTGSRNLPPIKKSPRQRLLDLTTKV